MSTDYGNIKSNRFAEIAKLGESIFHTSDLANLWQIKNSNTLYTTLKRYTKQGLLYRIYKGFYSIKPIIELDPFLLGVKVLHKYAYISTESVLISAGIMQQNIQSITLVSSKSKKFSIGGNNYYCRQLSNKYLYNQIGVLKKNGVYIASANRAIADLLYFNPNAYLDGREFVNWPEVEKIQKNLGYPLIKKTL